MAISIINEKILTEKILTTIITLKINITGLFYN
jgi:hypothetical protein